MLSCKLALPDVSVTLPKMEKPVWQQRANQME